MLPTYLTVSLLLLAITHLSHASWGTPGLGQYHIQTDEGPERFFRYQTDSGQYRKEKRLQDGTVVGTEAWIDAIGYLRQKDYIADNQGFRILKSKTVFVGRNRPIEEAIKYARKSSAQAGVLAKPQQSDYSINAFTAEKSTTVSPPVSSNYVTKNSVSNSDKFYTPSNVYINTRSNAGANNPLNIPSRSFEPPTNDIQPIAVYNPPSTPSPIKGDIYDKPANYYSSTPVPTTTPYSSSTSRPTTADYNYPTTTESPSYPEQDISRRIYSPIPISSTTAKPVPAFADNNIDVQPLYSRDRARAQPGDYQYYEPYPQKLEYNRNIGSGYDPQYPYYDGVAVTNNGFRYYLPRQYHEEENTEAQKRVGSFGYIDPFGIRRVVYYNSGPGQGFVVRKNNRYVGFNATPYDPRPL